MSTPTTTLPAPSNWLRSYYATRAAFSLAWVAAAVIIGKQSIMAAAVLMVIYPAWDALANLADARHNGGLKNSPTQTFNVIVSAITALSVLAALTVSMHAVLGVFGVWASFSGILQLATALRRWKTTGAQWAMVLSGAQSTLAGGFMVYQALSPTTPSITDIAPYAAFGAFYFLVAAVQLWMTARRTK